MKLFLILSVLLILLTQSLSALTFGVVPQQSPLKLLKVWEPIAMYLQEELGEKVELKIEHSIPAFEKKLYSGAYDIAYVNPYHYILAHREKGYSAKLRAKKNIVGIIVVQKESVLHKCSQLLNKKLLFPAPDAFAATLLVKYELLKYYNINIDKQQNFLYVNSHDSVYKGVARGIGDAGGAIERTLNNLDDYKSKSRLRILYKTQAYPSHPIIYKPSLANTLQKSVSTAFLNMPKKLLDALSIEKIIQTTDTEYDVVRDVADKLHLQK